MTKDLLSVAVGGFVHRLFLPTHSVTEARNQETLRVLQKIAPIELKQNSIGSLVYNCVILYGWFVWDALIKGPYGNGLEVAS